MKVENLIVKQVEFNNKKIHQLFIVINGIEYLLGTIKDYNDIHYVNCIHKEYKK